MKPTEKFYDFFQLQKAFLEQIELFDPEPQILEALRLFPEVEKPNLTRLLTYQTISAHGQVNSPQSNLEVFPFKQSLSQIPHGPLFRIHEVEWFLTLWENKNRNVPIYAPKRLSNGLKFLFTNHKLIVSFQKVSTELWLASDHNPTIVIPLTSENFDTVIRQHVNLAKKYLKSKE